MKILFSLNFYIKLSSNLVKKAIKAYFSIPNGNFFIARVAVIAFAIAMGAK